MKTPKSTLVWLISLIIGCVLFAGKVTAQATYTPTSVTDATSLAQNIFGNSVQIVSATLESTAPLAAGTFVNGKAANLSLDSGVILCTGNINDSPGPNNDDSTTTEWGTPGDDGLSALLNNTFTADAAILDFTFIPNSSSLTLYLQFGSDEYDEWVGDYNDGAAVFLNGQAVGLVGQNPVLGVGTVNLNVNSDLYLDNPFNSGFYKIQYDGLTKVIAVPLAANAGVQNELRLVVADAKDYQLDSALFISGSGEVCPGPLINVQIAQTGQDLKTGAAAVGFPGDYWNALTVTGEDKEQPIENGDSFNSYAMVECLDNRGQPTPITVYLNSEGDAPYGIPAQAIDGIAPVPTDPLLEGWLTEDSGSALEVDIWGLDPHATYDLYFYGMGQDGLQRRAAQFEILTNGYPSPDVAVDQPNPANTDNGLGWDINTWQEGNQYVVLRNVHFLSPNAGTTRAVRIRISGQFLGGTGFSVVNGLQIVCHENIDSVTATPLSAEAIKLSWTQAYGAQGYDIYRSLQPPNTPSRSFTHLATVSGNTYTNSGLEANTTYYYLVVPHAGCGEGMEANATTLKLFVNVQIAQTGQDLKTGAAAVGFPGDYWNALTVTGEDKEQPIENGDSFNSYAMVECLDNLGYPTPITVYLNSEGDAPYGIPAQAIDGIAPAPTDPLLEGWLTEDSGSALEVDIWGLDPQATYDLYFYGMGQDGVQRRTAQFEILTNGYPSPDVAVDQPNPVNTDNGLGWDINTWQESNQYVVLRNVHFLSPNAGTIRAVRIRISGQFLGGTGFSVVNGLQIVQQN